MRPPTLLLLALLLAPLTALAGGGGGIYRYVEKDGTVVYTNVPPAAGRKAEKLKGTFHAAPSPSEPARLKAAPTAELDQHIDAAARRYKVPASLVRAVVHAESNFDSRALSPKGASGLMQLMPETAREMFVKDIFDPRQNIEGGTRYLRVLANQYGGDMVKMVAAYNAGPEAIRKYGGNVPPYAETQAYVRKVIQLYFHYKERERLALNEPREANSDGDDARDGANPDGSQRNLLP
jgi:soluble lytic murein transglycosylase-like protein